MAFTLRPYQQNACDAAIAAVKVSTSPCLIDAAPAAGKSFMVAYLAAKLHEMSGGKRVLCLAPSAELVRQNHEKYLMTGENASIFSASAGAKSTRHWVVFGTPKTVSNSISRFTRTRNDGYCAVIVDESHGITPTILAIINEMREANPQLRVIGLTGTPYRLNTGYIFRMWPDGKNNNDDTCRDPYFAQCVYRVSAREMLDEGFITPMVVDETGAENYDTSGIKLLKNGEPNLSDVERAFEGHGRKTAAIVADVIARTQARGIRGGVMLFAATVRHAREVLASLPPDNSAIVTGATGPDACQLNGKNATRKQVIAAYRAGDVRYLVSVGTLTTGFDVSHTAGIALLRFTESAALLQQIMGRAWRLDDGKLESFLWDYAGNVDRHFPDGDIYNPIIKAGKAPGNGAKIEAECPDCRYTNEFTINPDCVDYEIDINGYCVDVEGARIDTEYGPMAAHFGQRCNGLVQMGCNGEWERCTYYWTHKECEHCGAANSISARYCRECKGELIDPNEKLISDFKAMKRDPTRPQTDRVVSFDIRDGMSQRGNRTIRVDFVTEYRQFSVWFMPDGANVKQQSDYAKWQGAEVDGIETVSYLKEASSGFYRILAYNRAADDADLPNTVAMSKDIDKLRRYSA